MPFSKMHFPKILQILVLNLLVFYLTLSFSRPLSTSSRWIVHAKSGRRVKLHCVNWAGHVHAMIPEGLHKRPLKEIVGKVASMGFNCVRLTWATYMFTKPKNINLTAAKSLARWNLQGPMSGLAEHNPQLLNLTVIQVQMAVVNELGAQNVMVVLDNHVSLPKWCCSMDDGNGFFGDKYFGPNEWLEGLTAVARLYKKVPAVVAMSLRNELRGQHQNPHDWHRYMQKGANAIRRENPEMLVIVSGLSFDTDLYFLRNMSLGVDLGNKLVYEAHWYSFSQSQEKWLPQTNKHCADSTQWFFRQAGFLFTRDKPTPLFLSEFGKDQRGINEADNRYFVCLLATVAGYDLDWALWTLQGSYMLREGKIDPEETYGMLGFNWDRVRNETMLNLLQLIQQRTRDPDSKKKAYNVMYHPHTGQCVNFRKRRLQGSNCNKPSKWSHHGNGGPIKLIGHSMCITAVGDGLPVIMSKDCSSQRSLWNYVSVSKLHLAAKDEHGMNLCLDWDATNSAIVTRKCLCLTDDLIDVLECHDNPQSQWFKFVLANTKIRLHKN